MNTQSYKGLLRLLSAILICTAMVTILVLSVSIDVVAGKLVPPQVLAVHPAPGSHDAAVTTPISITYDMDMDPATVNPQTFAVHARQTGWLTDTISIDGGMIKLQPTEPLHAGELVQVSATTGTLNMDGEAPLKPTVWQFTTAPWGGNAYFHVKESRNDPANRDVAIGDLDGDGDLDMVTSNCGGDIYVLHNDGSANFAEVQHFNLQSCISDVDFGDLDGDGDLDAFLVSLDAVFPDRFLFNNGDGTFTLGNQSLMSTTDTYSELGDLDGDSDLDIFVVSGGFELGTIRTWENDGSGVFSLMDEFDVPYEHTGVALGDLNNDGFLDAFTAAWNYKDNKVWLNDGTGHFTETQAIPNANTYMPLLGDLDGDGDLDVYLATIAINFTHLPDEVWINDGTGQFTNSGQLLNTPRTLIPALGDLDADGDLDVYVSAWDFAPDEVWLNDGEGDFSLGHSMDEYDDGALAWLGDLDGDGNLDAVTGDASVNYVIFLNGDWTQATPLEVPLAANLVQCVDDPDSFYMVGGILTGNVTTNQLIRYDIDTASWDTSLTPMPEPRRAAAAACYQGNIYVAGGVDYFIYDSFYIYNILSNTWSSGPSLPDPVWGAALGAWDGKLYLVGGNQDGYPYPPVDSVEVFDLTSGTWIEDGGKEMPTASCFFGTAQAGPYLYAVGGYSGDFAHNVNQTQRYNMAINEWEVGPEFTSARGLGTLAATSSHLYMLGGDLDGGMEFDATDLVEVLDLTTWPDGSWTVYDPLPANNLYPATACSDVLTGGEIWAVGGADGSFNIYDTNLYYPTGEPCVSFGVDLSDTLGYIAEPGEIVTYTLSITNTGVVTDYFTLEVSTTWNTKSSMGGPGPIGAGESLQIEIIVEVPLDAQWRDVGVTEITAASISNPTAIDTTSITTTVYWPRFFIPMVVKN